MRSTRDFSQKIYKELIKKKLKMGKWAKQTFLQRKHTNGQATHEEILDINIYWRNANANLQWDLTSHKSEWPSSKLLQTVNAGESGSSALILLTGAWSWPPETCVQPWTKGHRPSHSELCAIKFITVTVKVCWRKLPAKSLEEAEECLPL